MAPGLLAEVLAHSGDMRIPLRLPFEPDPRQVTAAALDFLTGPVPLGLVPLRRLRGIRLQATDIDRAWGKGPGSPWAVSRTADGYAQRRP